MSDDGFSFGPIGKEYWPTTQGKERMKIKSLEARLEARVRQKLDDEVERIFKPINLPYSIIVNSGDRKLEIASSSLIFQMKKAMVDELLPQRIERRVQEVLDTLEGLIDD
jgi:hypothetical protein